MKIRTVKMAYDKVIALPKYKHTNPKKPNMFFRTLLKLAGLGDLNSVGFSYKKIGMDALKEKEPALFLMNHSSFIDLEIAASVLYPRPLNIVCTSDGFVGKEWLMRQLGCIPTRKFITDVTLVRDMFFAAKKLASSILMYPEASYSFDGTATPLPKGLSKCIKKLGIPVVMIKTEGAFLRDPLYNMLQKRNVKVSATLEYILSPEKIKELSNEEISAELTRHFSFDNFRDQQKNRIKVDERFRADGLNRVLYKCPSCMAESKMKGSGTTIKCTSCGKEWELSEYGFLKATDGNDIFDHIPDWYHWERESVKNELLSDQYKLDIPVTIRMMVDMKQIYEIGDGRLTHTRNGFRLTSSDGKLDYHHAPLSSYSLYSDYYWYELGDMICIGDTNALYYCFPKVEGDIVAKARLAAEELYKIAKGASESTGGFSP